MMNKENIVFIEKPNHPSFKDREGYTFGRLLVLGFAGRIKKTTVKSYWWCECECKNILKVETTKLAIGHTQSCGCLQKERTSKARTIHGMESGPEYNSYRAARERCNLSTHVAYHNYGGRGIEFRFNDFVEFYEELGEKPEPKEKYTIERINVNGHYEKGNVRWATYKEQARNKRSSKKNKL